MCLSVHLHVAHYEEVNFSLTLSLMVICLSRLIQKSCEVSSRLLAEKLVINNWLKLSRKASQLYQLLRYDQKNVYKIRKISV
jgi:hypothetical protein